MPRIITVHSFRGGTGKSNTVANLATLLAVAGQRVGVVDMDIRSPSLHILFDLDAQAMRYTLNDYLRGACAIKEPAYDITARVSAAIQGRIFLIPASSTPSQIAVAASENYDEGVLNDGLHQVIADLELDVLMLDTHPGLSEEGLLAMAVSNTCMLLLRPDQQDYYGTAIMLDVARQLDLPRPLLVVNNVPANLDSDDVRAQVEQRYGCDVVAMLPHAEPMLGPGNTGIFVLRYSDHQLTAHLTALAATLTS
ncbi:MAG: MinD/ParA family protein [Chloroflexota bacterium]|nr:MinD/ParA family protein [Chloroflexota bacterium]